MEMKLLFKIMKILYKVNLNLNKNIKLVLKSKIIYFLIYFW